MTAYRKQSHEDQNYRRILKAARKHQYRMFPAPIAFLNDELKAEEEEDDAKFCSLKVPMGHEEKETKTYIVEVKKYDSGTPEEFLRCPLVLNKQMKNHGFMILAYAMLAGRSLEALFNERRAQETKNKTRKANEQMEYNLEHIYNCEIFELTVCDFDIQSGRRNAYERQREYMRRDLFMGKLNPEKFSQILKYLNKYLDYIPILRATLSDKTRKAYGKSLPEDEIRSIMGRAIPTEWTVNLLALGK
jgi:hypothetical protein